MSKRASHTGSPLLKGTGTMEIRTATMADLPAVTQLEAICFPEAEAATEASFALRLEVYPNHFWILTDGKTVVSFVNGMTTNEPDLRDEMYDNAALHNENGAWQMIFGVDTHPDYHRRGCAGRLLAFCREQQYDVCGDYLCEVMTEANIFDSDDRRMYLRLQVPVRFR